MTGKIDTSIELLKAAIAAEKLKVGDTATPEANSLLSYLLDNFPTPAQGTPPQTGRAARDLNYDLILLKMGLVPNKRVPQIPKIDDEDLIIAMWPLGMLQVACSVFHIHYETRRDGTRVPNPLFVKFNEHYGYFISS